MLLMLTCSVQMQQHACIRAQRVPARRHQPFVVATLTTYTTTGTEEELFDFDAADLDAILPSSLYHRRHPAGDLWA